MLALLPDLYPFAARTDEVFQGGIQINRMAHLIEVSHLQIGSLADMPLIGREFSQNQLEQRGLACSIWANQADLVAAQNGRAEIPDDGAVAKRLGHAGQFGNDFSARGA